MIRPSEPRGGVGGTGAAGVAATPAPAASMSGTPRAPLIAKGIAPAEKPEDLPSIGKNGGFDYDGGRAGYGGYGGLGMGRGAQLADQRDQPTAPGGLEPHAAKLGLADLAKETDSFGTRAGAPSAATDSQQSRGYRYGAKQAEPLLLVRCNVSAEAVRGQAVQHLLEKQQIAWADRDDEAEARGAPASAYLPAFRSERAQIVVQAAKEIQVDVQATPEQVVAMLADLKARPNEFSSVSFATTTGDRLDGLLNLTGAAQQAALESAARRLQYRASAKLPGPADAGSGQASGRSELQEFREQEEHLEAVPAIQGKSLVTGLGAGDAGQRAGEGVRRSPTPEQPQTGQGGLLGGMGARQEGRPARPDLQGQEEPPARPDTSGLAGQGMQSPPPPMTPVPSKGPGMPAEGPGREREEEATIEKTLVNGLAQDETADKEKKTHVGKRAEEKSGNQGGIKPELAQPHLQAEQRPEEEFGLHQEVRQSQAPSPAQPPDQGPPPDQAPSTLYVRLVFQIVNPDGSDVAASIAEEAPRVKAATQAGAETSQVAEPPAAEAEQPEAKP
jgi:hypothetical protein